MSSISLILCALQLVLLRCSTTSSAGPVAKFHLGRLALVAPRKKCSFTRTPHVTGAIWPVFILLLIFLPSAAASPTTVTVSIDVLLLRRLLVNFVASWALTSLVNHLVVRVHAVGFSPPPTVPAIPPPVIATALVPIIVACKAMWGYATIRRNASGRVDGKRSSKGICGVPLEFTSEALTMEEFMASPHTDEGFSAW